MNDSITPPKLDVDAEITGSNYTGTKQLVFKTDFPAWVDNSMRSTFVQCGTKWIRNGVQCIEPIGGSVHLHAGGAFAKALEELRLAYYRDKLPLDDALAVGHIALINAWGDYEPPVDTPKTLDRLLGALDFYTQEWPLDSDHIKPYVAANGAHCVEFSFALPTEVKHPQTGDPIVYCGRTDMIGVDRYGVLFVEDDKTATQLGQQWSQQWDLDSAMTGYIAAAKHFGMPVAGGIYRGISILKTKYGRADAVVYRDDWEIKRWWRQLHFDIENMISVWRSWREDGFVPMALDKTICGRYGGCGYRQPCMSQDPLSWLQQGYEQKTWDPLAKE